MSEIRVRPEQLKSAAEAIRRSVADVLVYRDVGPPALSDAEAGDISLAEATGKFSKHWEGNVTELQATATGLIKFLDGAAESYSETDPAPGDVGLMIGWSQECGQIAERSRSAT